MPPASECDARPDELDDAERPRALEEAVGRRRQARSREGEDEPCGAILEGIEHEHGSDRDRAERREEIHPASLRLRTE